MTKEELLEKFGHIELEFMYYRKFQFSFGSLFYHDGKYYDMLVIVGGSCDDIYRTSIVRSARYTIETLIRYEEIHTARLIERGDNDEHSILYLQ